MLSNSYSLHLKWFLRMEGQTGKLEILKDLFTNLRDSTYKNPLHSGHTLNLKAGTFGPPLSNWEQPSLVCLQELSAMSLLLSVNVPIKFHNFFIKSFNFKFYIAQKVSREDKTIACFTFGDKNTMWSELNKLLTVNEIWISCADDFSLSTSHSLYPVGRTGVWNSKQGSYNLYFNVTWRVKI